MKRNILHTLWAAAAVLLTACTQEELPLPGTNNATPLAITITDGGYAPAASPDGLQKAITRATENGYRTEFTAGDECGLYIVRNGEIAYNNVKLTATAAGTGGSLTWESGETLAGGMADEHYFLYYPYQADMTGKVTASATSDADFFATLISGWQPTADQSDYAAGYTASDLMTATGMAVKEADGKLSLSFDMTHRMALAVIEMPKTVYHFTDTSIPDYAVSTAADFTAEAKPYRNSDGTYRYLVNPSQTAPSLTGSYDDGKKEFTLTPNGIATGSYKTYRVDGAQIVQKNHNLQRGDFLLADGNIVGEDDLTEEQKASVSAIVFWTPSETSETDRTTPARLTDDKIMSAAHPDCTRGLAVAVKEVTYNGNPKMPWQPSGSYDHVKVWQAEQEQYAPSPDGFVSVASNSSATDNINRIYGYQNTLVLRAYNAYCLNTPAKVNSVVQPVAALDEFVNSNACPAPPNSTGWFLPSAKELHMLCYKDVDHIWNGYGFETRDIVNTSLTAAGGVALEADYYWSSSEYESFSDSAFYVSFYYAYVYYYSKSYTFRARAVCAF